jgi:solute carrier family 50 (sugar transporter)
VLVPNAIGIVAGLIGVGAYQKYSSGVSPALVFVATAILAASAGLAYVGNYHILGLIGCVLAVILSGSPLATVKTVIRDKSTAALPFATSLTTWLNALSWASYGCLVAHDPMIWGPNSLGLTLASVQLLLFAVFGFPTKKAAAPKIF